MATACHAGGENPSRRSRTERAVDGVRRRLEESGESVRSGADDLADWATARVDHAVATGQGAADAIGLERVELDEDATTEARIGGSVMAVTRGIIAAVVALIVLGALYNTDIVANPENPNAWTNMTSTFADYGTTAFTLIGVGLIAVAAGVALAYFGGMGGDMGGGR